MKIISGKYKGRILEGFDITGTRPTMDRVKESLFAMIQEKIPNSVVLDLFSGSGNLGIEALSEGASFAYLVDSNRKAIQTIERNLAKIGISNASTLFLDYQKAIHYFSLENIKLDIIFLDPPYNSNFLEKSINLILKEDILNVNGILVCESNDLDKIIYPEKLEMLKQKKYGDKYVVILKKIC